MLPLPQPISGMTLYNWKIGFTALLLLGGQWIQAQQLAQYASWLNNPYLYNPAAAGLDETLVANGIYRSQWVDLEGAPVSQHLDAAIPVRFLSSGLGIKMDNDQLGPHQTTQVMASYSYQRWLGAEGRIALGVSAGIQQYSLDGRKLRSPQGSYQDPSFQHNDQWLPEGRVSAAAPVAELGIYIEWRNWQAGLAALPVFAPQLSRSQEDGRFRLQPERHYVLQVGYQQAVGEDLAFRSGVLVKTDGKANQLEGSFQAFYREKFLVGVGFRGLTTNSRDAIMAHLGMRLNEKTLLLYTYEWPLSGLGAVNRGSHEIGLQYRWGAPIGAGKLPPVINNPRFR